MQISKNILVAPLNWGLGHATRCIPIIRALIDNGDNPIIASDGIALQYLRLEFPDLTAIEIPSYNITYADEGESLRLKLIRDTPKMLQAIQREHKILPHLVARYNLQGVISDNRLGLYCRSIPCIFITHQLKVLSGATTWLSTQLHRHFIKKFDACWIPDFEQEPNLAGVLSQNIDLGIERRYLGPLSRFKKNENATVSYDLLVLLSGPEPQRSLLEKKLLHQLELFKGKVLFVAGKVEADQRVEKKGRLTYYNFLSSIGMQKAMDRSTMVLCRSGYSSIMDLAIMEKPAFFIPTPGQYEQEYLASYFEKMGMAPYATQDKFTIDMLDKVSGYVGMGRFQDSKCTLIELMESTFSRVNENSEPIPSSLST